MANERLTELQERAARLEARIEVGETYVASGDLGNTITAIANLQLEIARSVHALLWIEIRAELREMER